MGPEPPKHNSRSKRDNVHATYLAGVGRMSRTLTGRRANHHLSSPLPHQSGKYFALQQVKLARCTRENVVGVKLWTARLRGQNNLNYNITESWTEMKKKKTITEDPVEVGQVIFILILAT